jgi:hypothetical protein
LARAKKKIHLGPDFDEQVCGWQEFIGSIPGHAYDGVDIAETDEGGVDIVAGYAKAGGQRKEFTAQNRADMEAYAGKSAVNVTKLAG